MVYKKLWPFIVLVILILTLLIVKVSLKNHKEILWGVVSLGGEDFQVEIVSSPQDMYNGLSKREELCVNCGMLFTFSDLELRTFSMRDMEFPLDIIFIKDNEIVKIYNNLQAEGDALGEKYSSVKPINHVLEINAGKSDALGIKAGDKIEILN